MDMRARLRAQRAAMREVREMLREQRKMVRDQRAAMLARHGESSLHDALVVELTASALSPR
jgi:hypothetical protein